jgi:hypothetical protein
VFTPRRERGLLRGAILRRGATPPVLAVEAAPDGRVYFSDQWGIYRLT